MGNRPSSLHHNLIALPAGKNPADTVAERHDIVLLFDATKANPNGDPDTGNMPRLQPDTLRGLVTDVCLKRKIRNFFSLYHSDGTPRTGDAKPGYTVFIRENAILEEQIRDGALDDLAKSIFVDELKQPEKEWKSIRTKKGKESGDNSGDGKKEKKTKKDSFSEWRERAINLALSRHYFDIRFFGAVTSTEGPLKGSFYGQIRGPLQFAFAESLDRVLQLDATITRCAVASEKEKKLTDSAESEDTGNRTMGRKHLVDYGLYRTHIYFSPAFAAKTGFTYYDLDNFFFALMHMFRDDNSAGRTGLRVVGLVDFQHASSLGNEHAHKLFELVKVSRTEESRKRGDYPNSRNGSDPLHENYSGSAPEGNVREVLESGQTRALVTARKLVWEFSAASGAANC
jgi:CRISPR-associated protein Csd2